MQEPGFTKVLQGSRRIVSLYLPADLTLRANLKVNTET